MEYFPSVSSSFTGSCSDSNKEKKKSGKKSKGVVKLSTDPQSVAARERRHRISERFKILQSMVPGGTKMDTVSMLDEAIHYVKFLKTQIWLHQTMISFVDDESSLFFANSLPSQETMYTNNFTNLNSAEMPPQPLQVQLPPMPKLSDCCFHGDVRALPYEHAYTKYE